VKVQMPLYQGGGLTARRNAAGHAVEAAQSTIQRTRLDVRQKLLEARSQVMSLQSTLQIQGRQEALSARTRELYQQQYLDSARAPARRAQRRTGGLSGALHPAADRWSAAPAQLPV
jgi:adhesin transport system outer membrane protein